MGRPGWLLVALLAACSDSGPGSVEVGPDGGVEDSAGARVNNGYVWLTFPAALGGTHPRLRLASGAVVLEVKAGGASYDMSALTASGAGLLESYTSTAP